MINKFLEHHGSKYRRVLAVDVRDTAFQRDPFPLIVRDKGVYVFEDDPSKTISECAWNSGWIKSCFGETVLDGIGER
jgi:hypothetical protein